MITWRNQKNQNTFFFLTDNQTFETSLKIQMYQNCSYKNELSFYYNKRTLAPLYLKRLTFSSIVLVLHQCNVLCPSDYELLVHAICTTLSRATIIKFKDIIFCLEDLESWSKIRMKLQFKLNFVRLIKYSIKKLYTLIHNLIAAPKYLFFQQGALNTGLTDTHMYYGRWARICLINRKE